MKCQTERKDVKSSNRWISFFSAAFALPLLLAGCTVGPKYQRPTAQTPAAYKENKDWKVATPQDATVREKWWEVYNDPQLNALEEQVNVSNQSVAAAFASFLEARALVKEARAQYFPTVSTAPSITNERQTHSYVQPPPPKIPPSPSIHCHLTLPGSPISGAACATQCGQTPRRRRPAPPIFKIRG